MKKMITILVPMVIILIPNIAFASEIEDYLDGLIYIELQIAAVTTDMYMYLGWFPDEKVWMKEASEKAIADLDEVKAYLTKLNLSDELAHLKDMNLQLIDKLKKIYNGIEKKKIEDIKREFVPFNELYSQYSEEFKEALKKYRHIVELPDNFEPINEEIKLIQNQKDRDIYLNAINHIKGKKYKEAYKDLNDLLSKYGGTTFESCITLKISDCLLMTDSDIEKEGLGKFEEGIDVLSKIIDKNKYSPVLYEAFYKWRTVTQEFYHGMSNMSKIPNKEYNQKRWKVVQTIKQYLKNNPDDIWAREQVDQLLSLPNIARGGKFGNDNLMHWGMLYTDIRPEKTKE